MEVDNSTIADNYSYNGGGGVVNYEATSTISSTTISDNGAADGLGGGIDNLSGSVTLSATIVAENGPVVDCAGTITDGGYVIDDDGTCGGLPGPPAIDDYLGTLGLYGGPTETVPLLPSPSPSTSLSDPALGVVPGTFDAPDGTSVCSHPDQRGITREAPCDVGAFELQQTNLTFSSSATSIPAGGSVTYTATVVPFPDAGSVDFSDGPGGPASEQCSGVPVVAGVATCKVSYPIAAPYSVTATYTGDSDFASSQGAPITVDVGTAESTTILLAVSQPAVLYGLENSETFRVGIVGQNETTAGWVKGSVSVYGTLQGSGTSQLLCSTTLPRLDFNVSCSLSANQLSPGTYTNVFAQYIPGLPSASNESYYYMPSKSVASFLSTFTVSKRLTLTALSVVPSQVSYGNENEVVFSVKVSTLGLGVPNGEAAVVNVLALSGLKFVTLTTCDAAPLVGGNAFCKIGPQAVGQDCIPKSLAFHFYAQADYPGDVDFAASSSTLIPFTVLPPLKAPICT